MFSKPNARPSGGPSSASRRQSRRRRPTQLRLEPLEDRVLLYGDDGAPHDGLEKFGLIAHDFVTYLPDRPHEFNYDGFLTSPTPAAPRDVALGYLASRTDRFGASAVDLASANVTNEYRSAHNGVTHIYLRQRHNGLDVLNADININVTPQGEVVNAGGGFVRGLNGGAGLTVVPSISPIDAVRSAAQAMRLGGEANPSIVSPAEGVARKTRLSGGGVSNDEITARLVYVPAPGGSARLAWNFQISTLDGNHWYDLAVDAENGVVEYMADWVANARYEVVPFPVESPLHGPRQVVVDPHDPIASPYGWHDTDGDADPDSFFTHGNNVFAEQDRDGNDRFGTQRSPVEGIRAWGGPDLDFQFPADLSLDPATYQPAAITNLFYWNNVAHDVFYRYGFDERSGNFQWYNYRPGGLERDAVQADAQDSYDLFARNNANFGTPPDGQPPRMQMYVSDFAWPPRDGDLDNGVIIHEYGHGVSNRLTGGPANAGALYASQSLGMGEGWSDFFALMFTQTTGDAKLGAYPIGTYLFGQQPNGIGIRTYPYSFDMTVDPLTLDDYNNIFVVQFPDGLYGLAREPHLSGEIWASTLWDMNWLLIDKHGYDSDLYRGKGGNNLAMQLVLDGMKLQPALPTFTQARDAILMADQVLTGGENQLEIWTAFARRGLGIDANVGPSAHLWLIFPDADPNDPNSYVMVVESMKMPERAFNDGFVAAENLPQTLSVLANDLDPDGINVASVEIVSPPKYGTATVNRATGEVTYFSTSMGDGVDSFTYTFRDSLGNLSNAARARVRRGERPAAANDFAMATFGAPATISVLVNDVDRDGTLNLGSIITTAPTFGTAAVNAATGTISYTPAANFTGADRFEYTVRDNHGLISNRAVVTVWVNAAPTGGADVAVTNEDTPITIDVLANDADASGPLAPWTVFVVTPPTRGGTHVDPVTGEITYIPLNNTSGADSFQYTVRDFEGTTSPAIPVSVTINPVDDPPVTKDDVASTPVGTTINQISVLLNDSDLEGNMSTGTVALFRAPAHGDAVINSNGTISYIPAPGYAGGDSLQYTVRDSQGGVSQPATVFLRVGDPVVARGFVYVDANNNGLKDPSELGIAGVTVTLQNSDPAFPQAASAVTDSLGAYQIMETVGVVLPGGSYDLFETQPQFYHDGRETAGVPLPAATLDDRFTGIALAAGETADGFLFGERGVRPEFFAAFIQSQALPASSLSAQSEVSLASGPLWVSFDAGWQGELSASATFASERGSVNLEVLNSRLQTVAASPPSIDSAHVSFVAAAGEKYFLKVSGDNPAALLRTRVASPAALAWHNVSNPLDVNGDKVVAPVDALIVINNLETLGNGTRFANFSFRPAGASRIDVDGDGVLAPRDALTVINHLDSLARSLRQAAPLDESFLPRSVNQEIALALAIDEALAELDASGLTAEEAAPATAPLMWDEPLAATRGEASSLMKSDSSHDEEALDLSEEETAAEHDTLDELIWG